MKSNRRLLKEFAETHRSNEEIVEQEAAELADDDALYSPKAARQVEPKLLKCIEVGERILQRRGSKAAPDSGEWTAWRNTSSVYLQQAGRQAAAHSERFNTTVVSVTYEQVEQGLEVLRDVLSLARRSVPENGSSAKPTTAPETRAPGSGNERASPAESAPDEPRSLDAVAAPRADGRRREKKKAKTYETAFRNYTRVKQLGQGGNGVVELVRDEAGQEYALKLVQTAKLNTEQLRRLKNEIGAGSRLRHANIVTVLDQGFFDDERGRTIFYVMPFYPQVLRKRIGSLRPDEAFGIAKGLAAALAHAHGEGVWHRDLKPENVALDSGGAPVLLDFGIAHVSEDLVMTPVETRDNTRFGNFQYAAPEQRSKAITSDHRADIYVFGMMVNELFTGIVPEGKNHKLIADVSQGHADLDALVDKMMSHDPARRPSAAEVLAVFGGHADPGPAGSQPVRGAPPAASVVPKRTDGGVTLHFVFTADGSSRRYAAVRPYDGPHPSLDPGAVYKPAGLDRDFVVRKARRTDTGVELWSETVTLPFANEFPDIHLRERLRNTGWTILEGGEIDEPE